MMIPRLGLGVAIVGLIAGWHAYGTLWLLHTLIGVGAGLAIVTFAFRKKKTK